jgi:acyl carrier protein
MPRYRDHYEFYLALLWGTIIDGARNISVNDSFSRLGGDSEATLSMLMTVEHEFEVQVSAERFAAAPTIEALAFRVREARRSNGAAQKPFRVPGSAPGAIPLVLLHTVEGELTYVDRLLGSDLGVPIVAVRSVGIDLEDEPLATVDAMARRYVAELDEMGVREPYVLAGISSSGVIAFEMARRWEERGDRVAYLGLFEPPPMRTIPFDQPRLVEMRLRELCQIDDVEFKPDQIEGSVNAMKDSGGIPSTYSLELVMRHAEIFALNVLSAYGHCPTGRFNGPTVLYESREFDCGGDPVGTLSELKSTSSYYERFWSRFLPLQTLVRRQNCDHRGIIQTRDTQAFLRMDIAHSLRALN